MSQSNGRGIIENYNDSTFIAYLDISGFKELMKKDDEARDALDYLYNRGYEYLDNHNNNVNNTPIVGLFVSDSIIMFPRLSENSYVSENFNLLLNIIKKLNIDMIRRNWMLMTAISYGEVQYEKRIETKNIRKEPVYGNGFVKSVLAHEALPNMLPGQCRIVIENLPRQIRNCINSDLFSFRMIKSIDDDDNHLYFYWMLNEPNEINDFEIKYKRVEEEFQKEFNNIRDKMYSNYVKVLKERIINEL